MMNAITIVGWNLLVVLALASMLFAAGRSTWLARRPAIRYVLWMLVLLKLVTPPMVRVPMLPALGVSSADAPAGPEQNPRFDGWSLPPSGQLSEAAELSPLASNNAGDAETIWSSAATWRELSKPATAASLFHRAAVGQWATGIAMGLSALGSLFILLTALYQGRQLRRLLRRCGQKCPRETQLAAEVAKCFGLSRTPRISLVDGPVSPMLWGAGRQPRLVLPRSLTETLDDRQLRNVIAHELAHFARWDQWTGAAAFSVCVVFWWFPVAWLARRQLQLASEACCDALAIAVLSHTRKSYAETLMKAVDYVTQTRCVQPQLASGFGGTKSLQRRIEMIANPDVTSRLSRRGRVWLALTAVCLIALPAWSMADPPSGASSIPAGLPAGGTASGGLAEDDSAVHSGVVGGIVKPDRIARVTLLADGTLKLNGRVVDTSAEPLAAKAGPGQFDAATIHVDCSSPPTDFTVPAAAARLREVYAQVSRWKVKSVYLHSTDETARAVCNAMIEQESQPGGAGMTGSRQDLSLGRALEAFDNQLAMQPELRREWARRMALDLTGLPADEAWLDSVAKAVSQEEYQRFIDAYLQRHGMLPTAENEIVDTKAYLVIDAYYMNAALADEQFTGRMVRLTGSVVRVSKLGDSRYILELKPLEGRHKTRLLMEFDLDWRSDLAKLQSNYHATVVGLCTGPGSSIEGDTILFRNCRLLKIAEPPSAPGGMPGGGGGDLPGGFGTPAGGFPGGIGRPPGGGPGVGAPAGAGGRLPPGESSGSGAGLGLPGAGGPGAGLGLPGASGSGAGLGLPGASGTGAGLGGAGAGLPGGSFGVPGPRGPANKTGASDESTETPGDSNDRGNRSGGAVAPTGGSGTRGSGGSTDASGNGTAFGVDETRSGRLLFGAGVNSDTGLTGELTIGESNFGTSSGSGSSAGTESSESSFGGSGSAGATTGTASDASSVPNASGGPAAGSAGAGASNSDARKSRDAASNSTKKDDR